MLIVIAIIVLIGLITVPSITPFLKGQSLSKGAMAINSRKTRRLVFDSTYSKLFIKDENNSELGREEFLPNNIEFDTSTGTWLTGTTTVSFTPNGSADISAFGTDTITIKNKQGNSKNLRIINYTGQISSN